MNLEELRSNLRFRLDDIKSPYLWGDEELDQFLNEAVDEYHKRKGGMAAVASMDLVAGTAEYVLDEVVTGQILRIERVKLEGAIRTTQRVGIRDLDMIRPLWGTQTADTVDDVKFYLYDPDSNTITLNPIPGSSTWSVNLTVYRGASAPMTLDASIPEVPTIHHAQLVLWAAHLAFSKRDADTYNPRLAEEFAQRFELMVGKTHSAADVDFERDFQQARVRPRAFI